MKITTGSTIGKRPYQEDRSVVIAAPDDAGTLLAVMDGHGGSGVAEFISQSLGDVFEKARKLYGDGNAILASTFGTLNSLTREHPAGTTLSLVWIPRGEVCAHVGILGDSPVIIKNPGEASWLSPEHNVRTNEREREMAISRGGICEGGYLYGKNREEGIQLSRALGDAVFDAVLDRRPEIFWRPIGTGSIILVATDGVLDPRHKATVAQIDRLLKIIEHGGDADAVVRDAVLRETGDNATAIVCEI
jgi:serine/threonine protein phosphatase PrpC